MHSDTTVIITARDEGEHIGATLAALARALPGARLVLADDGSRDATASTARAAGAQVVGAGRAIGKGGAATRAAQAALDDGHGELFLLCDGDLGASAAGLAALVETVRAGEADLAVARFARRVGGGLGVAVGFARWAIRRRTGLRLDAPISGQRALRTEVLRAVLPFAPRFGMEMAMTIDAARAGHRVREVEIELEHRATGRTLQGFLHRGRQLADFVLVYALRRG